MNWWQVMRWVEGYLVGDLGTLGSLGRLGKEDKGEGEDHQQRDDESLEAGHDDVQWQDVEDEGGEKGEAEQGVDCELRRSWRELFLASPDGSRCACAVFMTVETLRRQ